MNLLAQELLEYSQDKNQEVNDMAHAMIKDEELAYTEGLSEDIRLSCNLIVSAQETLSDLDKSLMELAELVDGLRRSAARLAVFDK